MDHKIVELFMKENDAWDHMIKRQKVELPQLDAMISNIVAEKKWLRDERNRIFEHLRKEVQQQQRTMEEVSAELALQQEKLIAERKRTYSEDPYALQAVNSQQILRNRIREVEKKFVELKCNYLNYVATI